MIEKNQRFYKLSVQQRDVVFDVNNRVSFIDKDIIEITNPLTIEFDIIRNNWSSLNSANFNIFNLSEKTRNFIRKDFYETLDNKRVKLEIGYENNLSIAFQGTISKAYSVRSGSNMITTIESQDGYFQALNSKYVNEFPKNTPKAYILKRVLASLENEGLYTKSISKQEGVILRGISYSGPTFELLNKLTNNSYFIDNELINILDDTQAVLADTIVIDSASGLLGTPTIENKIVSFEILMDSRIVAGQLLRLDSINFDNKKNSLYKVIGISHKGIISESSSGRCTTTLKCSPGNYSIIGGELNG